MGRTQELREAASYVARKENRRKADDLAVLLWTLFGSLAMGVGIMLYIIRS
jgi:hypothetical protein